MNILTEEKWKPLLIAKGQSANLEGMMKLENLQ